MPHIERYSASGASLDRAVESLGRDIEYYRSAGATTNRYMVAGQQNCTALTTGAPAIDTLFAMPFCSPRGGTLDRLQFNVTTVGGAGSVARCGIYTNSGASLIYPNALVVDGGQHDTSAVGGTGVKSATIDVDLDPGELYWFVYLCGTAAPTVRGINPAACFPLFGLDSTIGTAPGVGLSVAQAYGALPATFTASGTVLTTAPIPVVVARYSA